MVGIKNSMDDYFNKKVTEAKKELKKEIKDNEKKKKDMKTAVFFDVDGVLYHIVNHSKMGILWLKFENDNIEYIIEEDEESYITIDGERYYPKNGEEVKKEVILLPREPIICEEKDIDNKIKAHIRKYLDVPEEYLDIAILVIKQSWLYRKMPGISYLRVLGDFGSGKSRFLDVIGGLHYIPMKTQGAASAAVLFRLIDKWQGTLIIDEADLQRSDESADVIKILNCGYEKGRPVARCNKNDPNILEFYNVFCPKVLATRGSFKDKATESRCLTNKMRVTHRNNIPELLTEDFHKEQEELRDMLFYFMLKKYNKIDVNKGINIKLDGIEPRLKQIIIPILSITEDPIKVIEYSKRYQKQLVSERADTFEGQVILAMAQLHYGIDTFSHNFFTCSDICDRMHENNYETKNGYKPQSVSRLIQIFGFKTKQKKINGKNQRIVSWDSDEFFKSLVAKFVPDFDFLLKEKGNEVTQVTIVTKTTEKNKGSLGLGGRYHRYYRYLVTSLLDKFNGKITKEMVLEKIDPKEINYFEKDLELMKKEGMVYEPKNGLIYRI